MKTYTRKEREKIIKHVLDNDVTFFDDMFELAEGNKLLEQCENCRKYFIPADMASDDNLCCKTCRSDIGYNSDYEDSVAESYEYLVRGR